MRVMLTSCGLETQKIKDTKLDVHCEASSYTGSVSFPLIENMKLSNTAAIIFRSIPDEAEIIDG